MIHRTILSLFIVCSFTAVTHAASINLPASGQTTCYDTAGAVILCAGTGQDGDKQMGVSRDEASRFSNNGNGTITDSLTGLIWLQNANCTDTVGGVAKSSGYLTWADALTWSNSLASGACGLADSSTAGQWRLPTRKELASLINRGQADSATWLGTKGFSAVQSSWYWSSTTFASYTDYAWFVIMFNGYVSYLNKANYNYVWPVRGGQ